MKTIITGALLCLLTMAARAQMSEVVTDFAAENRQMQHLSKDDAMFSVNQVYPIRDFVYLHSGKMIIELTKPADYSNLKDIDTILLQLQKDIAFYKDSLDNGSGNVRIDYRRSTVSGQETDYMRFTKYTPQGDLYVKKNGETARLKLDQDTIRIIFEANAGPLRTDIRGYRSNWAYPIEVTFVVNNYTDIDKIVGQRETMLHALDTLAGVRTRKEAAKPFEYPTSCIYHPYRQYDPARDTTKVYEKYSSQMRFVKFPYLLKDEHNQFRTSLPPMKKIVAYGNLGAGVVRNTLSPNADLGLTWVDYHMHSPFIYDFVSVYASPFFFFDRNTAGGYYTADDWFINIETGSSYDKEMLGVPIRGFSVGVGYLAYQQGNYFTGTTMKIFATMPLTYGITISPELIATGNLKQVFPGINIKIFGIKRSKEEFY